METKELIEYEDKVLIIFKSCIDNCKVNKKLFNTMITELVRDMENDGFSQEKIVEFLSRYFNVIDERGEQNGKSI